ncbi:uncharacterized protein Fot_05521 [Forsythia ovata]|uniref:PB1 domain-containing protein n=1 Tax=Forsythia ovata TaxID=205694 RepID=A0ABD1WQD4_9LAMI
MEKQKVKLLCSYGGKIQPRPTDHQLRYVGGDTRILTVDRRIKFSETAAKLNSIRNHTKSSHICMKYQLPGEDLDALVSLIDDEDVEHMMIEYDCMHRISNKPARLRIFIFDSTPDPSVISGMKKLGSDMPLNPDYLFGFDKEYQPNFGPPRNIFLIPGMVMPENSSSDACGGGCGVGYQTGKFPNGVVSCGVNREQPVHNMFPVIPPAPEQRIMVVMERCPEMKV